MTWKQRIARARRRGGFFPIDLKRASSWDTCAVGEALNGFRDGPRVIPLGYGVPGLMFKHAVAMNDFDRATELLALVNGLPD